MGYFIAPDGGYPRHAGDIQRDFPDYVEGDVLPDGWVEVAAGELPTYDESKQVWVEIEPAVVDGVLTRQFIVRDLTKTELASRT